MTKEDELFLKPHTGEKKWEKKMVHIDLTTGHSYSVEIHSCMFSLPYIIPLRLLPRCSNPFLLQVPVSQHSGCLSVCSLSRCSSSLPNVSQLQVN